MPATDLTPVFDASQNQLGLTFSASDSLDTKALAVLGSVIALFIFTLQSEMANPWWLLAPLFLALAISAVFTIMVVWPREYRGAVADLQEYQEYLQLTQRDLVLQLIADTQSAVAINTSLNNTKSVRCGIAIGTSLVGVGFLVGCIL